MLIRTSCSGIAMAVSGSELCNVDLSTFINGRADVFSESDGLSGDIVMSLCEDREGNIWVATTGGIDRFRELPVTAISVKHGLSGDLPTSVVAGADRSIWMATQDGLTRWKDGQATMFPQSKWTTR